MARQKKTRKISDIMPTRKADKKIKKDLNNSRRYERDLQSRLEQKKRKHKGLASGSRNGGLERKSTPQPILKKDSRLGSRKKVPLIIDEVVGKKMPISVKKDVIEVVKPKGIDPHTELMQLENNECLNRLLDDIEAGKKLSTKDQTFVDECLDRIQVLMETLGLLEEEKDEDDALYQRFDKLDIHQFH